MKSILFITAFPPNQMTAGQDYSRRLILDLMGRGYEVSLLYATYPGHDVELPGSVRVVGKIVTSWWNCARTPSFHPFFTRRFNRRLVPRIQDMAKDFGIVYFDFSQVHLYSLFLEHPCKVLMCHDVICQKFARAGALQLPWIHTCEGTLLASASNIFTFSQKDCDLVACNYNLPASYVNFYLKGGRFEYPDSEGFVTARRFCFYGARSRPENAESLEWFMNHVFPLLDSSLEFIVIGGGMSSALRKRVGGYKNMKVLGFVSDPVQEIARCQALVAPLLKGAGVKVKVIDALSSGTAVIGSSVALEGIESNVGHKLFFLCRNSGEYVKVLNAWVDRDAGQKQGAADEFYMSYNDNHFPDHLPALI